MLDPPESVCLERNSSRADRAFGAHVVRRQRTQLHRSIKHLKREGFRNVWVLDSLEEIAAVEVTRAPLWTDRRAEHGPFDVIGDIHGCYDELVALLAQLGYAVAPDGVTVTPPEGRRAVFVGDYGDRGPDTPAVLRLVMAMAAAGTAICLPGNHDVKLHASSKDETSRSPTGSRRPSSSSRRRAMSSASRPATFSIGWSATRSSTTGLSLSRTPG